MIEIIGMGLIIAMVANTLLLSPPYLVMLKRLKLDRKPFNCSKCLGLHFSLIMGLFSSYIGIAHLPMVAVILVTPYLSALLERLFYSLNEGYTELNERIRAGKK